jgi:hypothetical protein
VKNEREEIGIDPKILTAVCRGQDFGVYALESEQRGIYLSRRRRAQMLSRNPSHEKPTSRVEILSTD